MSRGYNKFHDIDTGEVLGIYNMTFYDEEVDDYYEEEYVLNIRHVDDWVREFVDYLRFCGSPHHIESSINFEDFDDNNINIYLRGPVKINIYDELYFIPENIKVDTYNDLSDVDININNNTFIQLVNSILNKNEEISNKFKGL